MIEGMESLNLADTFILFLALLGPQKVLLSVARLTRTLDTRSIQAVVAVAAFVAACVGVACAVTAPWLTTFFHIGPAALQLAAGLLFFCYALCVVLGVHFDLAAEVPAPDADGGAAADADPLHPLTSGLRELLLPFMVSPLAVAAALRCSTCWPPGCSHRCSGARTRSCSRCCPGCSASCSPRSASRFSSWA